MINFDITCLKLPLLNPMFYHTLRVMPRHFMLNLILLISFMVLGIPSVLAENAPIKADDSKGQRIHHLGKPNAKVKRLVILAGQSNMAMLDETVSFLPALKKAFPHDYVLVVKDAKGGQPIKRWYPQSATEGKTRKNLYKRLFESLHKGLNGMPVTSMASVSVVWMQGEANSKGNSKGNQSDTYADSLKGLIGQLRRDLNRSDLQVVIGRLSDHKVGTPGWDAVRKAQVTVAESDAAIEWLDTDGYNGPGKGGLHFKPSQYAEMGKGFAAKVISQLK